MRIRLEPADEYPHELGPEPTFNESMYVNVVDPSAGFGAFFRLGNRANEGRAEVTVCCYLPGPGGTLGGGPVAFMFGRPSIEDNDSFDAAGLRFEVVEPFRQIDVSYEGPLLSLADPLELADPRQAFTTNPTIEGSLALTFTGASDPFGGEPEESLERPGEEFARGHYEQLVRGQGTARVGDQHFELDGYGLRDHSWGPRTWQAPFYYRWLTANVGPDFGFMASRIARRDSDGTRVGFLWEGEHLELIDDVRIRTDWDDDHHHRTVHAELGVGERSIEVRGDVLTYVPLRNRRDGQVTRIGEGLTRWHLADGRVGYGLAEYLDQLTDGVPVGLDE